MSDSELIAELNKSIEDGEISISDLNDTTKKGWGRMLQILRRHKKDFAENEWDVIKSGTSLAMKLISTLVDSHRNAPHNPYSEEVCLN